MIKISANMDVSGFQKSLTELAGLKKDVPKVLRRVAGNVVKDCVKLTPPFGGAPSTETFNAQRKIGQNAIKGDLLGGRKISASGQKSRGILFDIGDLDIDVKTGHKISGTKGAGDFQKLWVTHTGKVVGCEMTFFSPNASIAKIDEVHQAARSKKTGRVSTAGSKDREIGRTTFIDRMVTSTQAINRYLKHVYKKVGGAKHGWIAAVQKLNVKGIPNWVKNQSTPKGSCEIKGEGTNRMEITFENTVPYIQRKGKNLKIVAYAFQSTGVRLAKEVQMIMDARMRKAKRA